MGKSFICLFNKTPKGIGNKKKQKQTNGIRCNVKKLCTANETGIRVKRQAMRWKKKGRRDSWAA